MKSMRFIMIGLTAFFFGMALISQGQEQQETLPAKTESFKVWGNCEMCKSRIEKAAKIEGVSKAVWDTDTKLLTLVYNPSQLTSDEVQKKIAASGHDTEKHKADDKVYQKLPGCCHYERKPDDL